MKKLALAAALLAAGCASSPDKMTAADVSPLKYKSYDCDMIGEEGDRISRKITTLHQQLDKTSSNDDVAMGVGLVLFWPALFLLEGGDGPEAAEYRQLKGDYNALEEASIKKKCSIEFKNIREELEKQEKANKNKPVEAKVNKNFGKSPMTTASAE